MTLAANTLAALDSRKVQADQVRAVRQPFSFAILALATGLSGLAWVHAQAQSGGSPSGPVFKSAPKTAPQNVATPAAKPEPEISAPLPRSVLPAPLKAEGETPVIQDPATVVTEREALETPMTEALEPETVAPEIAAPETTIAELPAESQIVELEPSGSSAPETEVVAESTATETLPESDLGLTVEQPATQVRDLGLDAVALSTTQDPDEAIVAYRIVNGSEIPHSLTETPGDPELGRALYFDLEVTGCSGCHGSPGGPGAQSFAGQIPSPLLTGVGTRLDEGQIRLWIVSPNAMNPGSPMPAYYEAGQRRGAHDPLFGGPRLTAMQVEHLVAYLSRQKTLN